MRARRIARQLDRVRQVGSGHGERDRIIFDAARLQIRSCLEWRRLAWIVAADDGRGRSVRGCSPNAIVERRLEKSPIGTDGMTGDDDRLRRLILIRRVVDRLRCAVDASVALSYGDRKNHEQAGKQHGCSDENVSRHFCSSLAPILRFPCSGRSCPNCLCQRDSVARTDLPVLISKTGSALKEQSNALGNASRPMMPRRERCGSMKTPSGVDFQVVLNDAPRGHRPDRFLRNLFVEVAHDLPPQSQCMVF